MSKQVEKEAVRRNCQIVGCSEPRFKRTAVFMDDYGWMPIVACKKHFDECEKERREAASLRATLGL